MRQQGQRLLRPRCLRFQYPNSVHRRQWCCPFPARPVGQVLPLQRQPGLPPGRFGWPESRPIPNPTLQGQPAQPAAQAPAVRGLEPGQALPRQNSASRHPKQQVRQRQAQPERPVLRQVVRILPTSSSHRLRLAGRLLQCWACCPVAAVRPSSSNLSPNPVRSPLQVVLRQGQPVGEPEQRQSVQRSEWRTDYRNGRSHFQNRGRRRHPHGRHHGQERHFYGGGSSRDKPSHPMPTGRHHRRVPSG